MLFFCPFVWSVPRGTSGCSPLEVPPILASPVVSSWGWKGFPCSSAQSDEFLSERLWRPSPRSPGKRTRELRHVQFYHVCHYCLIASNFLAASMFFLCPFCLFSAPKYKWLFSPSSSFNLSLSSNFFLRMASVSLLAPVPGRTNLPVSALGALRLTPPGPADPGSVTSMSSSSSVKVVSSAPRLSSRRWLVFCWRSLLTSPFEFILDGGELNGELEDFCKISRKEIEKTSSLKLGLHQFYALFSASVKSRLFGSKKNQPRIPYVEKEGVENSTAFSNEWCVEILLDIWGVSFDSSYFWNKINVKKYFQNSFSHRNKHTVVCEIGWWLGVITFFWRRA